jgi:hypothetical protein
MHQSLTIARLVGPVLSAIGIGMLANQATYREMAAQFLGGLAFIYFSGVLMLVARLAILNAHPVWTRDWRSTVTAIGSGSSLVSARSASSRLSLPTSSPARLLPTPVFSPALASSCSRSAALSPSRVM